MDLESYKQPFTEIVRAYVRDILPRSEWVRFRQLAACVRGGGTLWFASERLAMRKLGQTQDLERLLGEAICVPACPLEVLRRRFRQTAIGAIEGRSVLFFPKEGIFAWERDPEDGDYLELWCTFPAYPPGW